MNEIVVQENNIILGMVQGPYWYKLFIILKFIKNDRAIVAEIYEDGTIDIETRSVRGIKKDRILA